MAGSLPNRIDPARLAEAGARIFGRMRFDEMPSLRADAYGRAGVAVIDLQFGRDDENRACVTGRISASTEVTCQRCMRPLTLELVAEVSLGIVGDEVEAGRLPECYEPLLAGDEPVALADLVEQELLLVWPMTPRHEAGMCRPDAQPATEGKQKGPNPFAVLEALRKGKS